MNEPAERFNIVIMSPAGYGFSETFSEISETISYGLRRMGHEAEIQINEFQDDSTNIILGAHLIHESAVFGVPPGSIIYNFEQVHGESRWIKPAYVDLVGRHLTWDYSQRNVDTWRRYCPGASVIHVPLGYVPELTRVVSRPIQDIDVLFYGVVNERRGKVLSELRNAGLRVEALTGVFGPARDDFISRAKVVLNLHFHPTRIFELPRVSYLLANGKAVVAEVDETTEIDAELLQGIVGVPYDCLVSACCRLVTDQRERSAIERVGKAVFTRRVEEGYLAAALARAPTPAAEVDVQIPRTINVGSGKRWNLECLNLDVDAGWRPDLVADLNAPLPPSRPVDLGRFGVRVLPADYFEEVRASHVLEHLRELVIAMESFLRLLKVGGIVDIEVPYDLSLGAWQDPTHVRAMNENSWLYYTEWFWYLGWTSHRFEMVEMSYILSEYGRVLHANGSKTEEIIRMPRAVDAMRVKMRKIMLTDAEKGRVAQRWE